MSRTERVVRRQSQLARAEQRTNRETCLAESCASLWNSTKTQLACWSPYKAADSPDQSVTQYMCVEIAQTQDRIQSMCVHRKVCVPKTVVRRASKTTPAAPDGSPLASELYRKIDETTSLPRISSALVRSPPILSEGIFVCHKLASVRRHLSNIRMRLSFMIPLFALCFIDD